MKLNNRSELTLLSALFLAACGGSAESAPTGSGGEAGATALSWGDYCQQKAARDTACGIDEANNDLVKCEQDGERCFGVLRSEARVALETCRVELPCDKSKQQCFAEVTAAMTPTPAAEAFAAQCEAKKVCDLDACDSDHASMLFTDAAYADLGKCMSKSACDEVKSCLKNLQEQVASGCSWNVVF